MKKIKSKTTFLFLSKMKFIILIFSLYSYSLFSQDVNINNNYKFHYEDIENFRKVLDIAKKKGDTLKALQNYFNEGSIGMKAWVKRYNIKPNRIQKAIKYFPKYYEYLSTIDSKLREFEIPISKGLDSLRKIYPSSFLHIPPVYYFILFSGGGSVEMTANMISVDYFGNHEGIDDSEFKRVGGIFPKGKMPLVNISQVPQVVIHETIHLIQSYIQGEFDYASIYEDKNRTVLAYLIREGSADFITYLASGIINTNQSLYGDKHEKDLWELIMPILEDDPYKHSGWFSGKSSKHPDWPFQIGYHLGFKIVKYFYDKSENKNDALNFILNSHQKKDFQKFIDKYKQKWK